LIFGGNFNQQIKDNILPASLRILKLGEMFNQQLSWSTLPINLSYLKVVENMYPDELLKYHKHDKKDYSYLLNIPNTHKYLTVKIKRFNPKLVKYTTDGLIIDTFSNYPVRNGELIGRDNQPFTPRYID